MSDLEGAAQPLLTRLMDGDNHVLTPSDAETLVRWATKTAMVFETTSPQAGWFFSAEERSALASRGEFPRLTRLWIARKERHSRFFCAGRVQTDFTESPYAIDGVHTATSSFLTLLLQLQVVRCLEPVPPQHSVQVTPLDRRWDTIANQVWPISGSGIEWPPGGAQLLDAEVEFVAGRFIPTPGDAA